MPIFSPSTEVWADAAMVFSSFCTSSNFLDWKKITFLCLYEEKLVFSYIPGSSWETVEILRGLTGCFPTTFSKLGKSVLKMSPTYGIILMIKFQA